MGMAVIHYSGGDGDIGRPIEADRARQVPGEGDRPRRRKLAGRDRIGRRAKLAIECALQAGDICEGMAVAERGFRGEAGIQLRFAHEISGSTGVLR